MTVAGRICTHLYSHWIPRAQNNLTNHNHLFKPGSAFCSAVSLIGCIFFHIAFVQRQFTLHLLARLPLSAWFSVHPIAFRSSVVCIHLFFPLLIQLESTVTRRILCAELKVKLGWAASVQRCQQTLAVFDSCDLFSHNLLFTEAFSSPWERDLHQSLLSTPCVWIIRSAPE